MGKEKTTFTNHDEQLALLLDEITHKRLDPEAACLRHPELAEELRHLLVIGQMVDYCAHTTSETTLVHGAAMAPRDEALPRTIGDYELREELGRGGMGVVYKAWDNRLERFVALKMVLRGTLASDADLGRFHGEAQAAAALTHPNIVPVYQVGAHDGQPYFCMKFVEGRTLADVVAEGPLHPRVAAGFLASIARAVQHAHEKGVLHRDLKPANILLETDASDPSGLALANPQVTDFGLAKRLEGGASLTGTGAIVGTPSYMAPEQADGTGRPSGPAADIYSLGAILYELLTGRPPFLAASAVETLLLLRSEEPVRPRLLNPRIDLDLEFICRKCLEKRPEHRYASAGKLADDLYAFIQGDVVSARANSLTFVCHPAFSGVASRPGPGKLGVALDMA